MADKTDTLDADGFRPNVGIVLANGQGQLFWGCRIKGGAWQFPQGGIADGESPEQALYRELGEEVGLPPEAVDVVARTKGWLRYRMPERFRRKVGDGEKPCVGQKQKWFLLRMLADDSAIQLDTHTEPEMNDWRWVSYWHPLSQIVYFKREVYRRMLLELSAPYGKINGSKINGSNSTANTKPKTKPKPKTKTTGGT